MIDFSPPSLSGEESLKKRERDEAWKGVNKEKESNLVSV